MATEPKDLAALRVASIEVLRVALIRAESSEQDSASSWSCEIAARSKHGDEEVFKGNGSSREQATAACVSQFCSQPIRIFHARFTATAHENIQVVAGVEDLTNADRAAVGRFAFTDEATGLAIAALRAANNAGLLAATYRANNQQLLRDCARHLLQELDQILQPLAMDRLQRLQTHGAVLDQLNKVASAAVVTAVNHPKPDTVLSLFDTSAWLFDNQGRRRDAYTDTKLWLAWYPGIENEELTINDVIASMPAAPESKIPWIVRLFENPTSWIRFRGAVDLEDHDVLHVLLGRGLQDQDEAFVLGFAMGTAKQVSWLQFWIFKMVLARLYPEPYRIPKFLQPAFDLGVQCGQQTGAKNLYRQKLKKLRGLTLGEAREAAGIDMRVLRRFYELEQQRIPFTIASLRLP